MRSILHHQSPTAQWQKLIKEAQSKILINLEEEIESYLVFLLMRFTNQPEIATRVLGLDFLNCYTPEGPSSTHRQAQLQKLGDHCLLFSGFFPGRAKKRSTQLSYFVKLGQTAYATIAHCAPTDHPQPLYEHLSLSFIPMMDVLLSLRAEKNTLDLFQAIDLWHNAHSKSAYTLLNQATSADPSLISLLPKPPKNSNH